MERTWQLKRFLMSSSVTMEMLRNFLHSVGGSQGLARGVLSMRGFLSKVQRQQRIEDGWSPGCWSRTLAGVESSRRACISRGVRLLHRRSGVSDGGTGVWRSGQRNVLARGCSSEQAVSRSGESGNARGTAAAEGMSFAEARRRGLIRGRSPLSVADRIAGTLGADLGAASPGEDEAQKPPRANARTPTAVGPEPQSHRQTQACIGLRVSEGDRVQDNRQVVQEPPMVDGEMVLAIRENLKRHEYLYRMFPLNASHTFRSKYGTLSHADVVGHLAGRTFSTDLGRDIMIRRPSLDEFVVHMKRTPVISYPKDCCTMLMMADIGLGDVVLEAGTGSGAMTLFLSRAVGPAGCVHTFDAKPEHQMRAVKNFRQWAASWNLGHPGRQWPNNVCFHSGKLEEGERGLETGLLVDAAVIDMELPHTALPTLGTRLRSGKAAVMYIANLTQIIEVVEYIRVHHLPLTIENILEVTHQQWVVHPARRNDGQTLEEARVTADTGMRYDEKEMECESPSTSTRYIEDSIPKYIARPHSRQHGHTAFLVKIRRIGSVSTTYKL